MKPICLFLAALFFTFSSTAQQLISATAVGDKSKEALISEYNLPAVFVKNGAKLYKVNYTTLDLQGVLDTASGLVAIPDITGTYPLLCYQHGTANSATDVPSVIDSDGFPQGDPIGLIFASFGFVVAAPDYLGLGDSRGFHPYVHADSEASAAIDLLLATRELMESQESSLNDQLFITGYSQGGHAAMAAHQKIQEEYADEFTVTAAAPMSGPYSISSVMKDLILDDEQYFFAAYIPYTFLSFDLAYDLFDEIEEYFKPDYAAIIEPFSRNEIDLGTLNSQLIAQLIFDTGGSFPKFMVQDSILAVANDLNHPLALALQANDTHNWVPDAPTRLYYCTADDQVPFRNSVFADSVFQANNAPDLGAIDVDASADHGACVDPAVSNALLFFLQFQEIIIANTEEVQSLESLFGLSPNPANNQVQIKWKGQQGYLDCYDAFGKRMERMNLGAEEQVSIDVSTWAPGVYLLIGEDGESRAIEKLVIE